MATTKTDFSKTLEQLTGLCAGDPKDAPTSMVERVVRAWKKPLRDLSDDEVGDLVVQHDGYPFLLDLLWPKLLDNPLYDGGHYPGDVLSLLLRADESIWIALPEYRVSLNALFERALEMTTDDTCGFRGSLGLPHAGEVSH